MYHTYKKEISKEKAMRHKKTECAEKEDVTNIFFSEEGFIIPLRPAGRWGQWFCSEYSGFCVGVSKKK